MRPALKQDSSAHVPVHPTPAACAASRDNISDHDDNVHGQDRSHKEKIRGGNSYNFPYRTDNYAFILQAVGLQADSTITHQMDVTMNVVRTIATI